MTDKWGDGWNKYVLAFRQNGTLTTFGSLFTNGFSYPTQKVVFKKYIPVDIIVYVVGSFSD